MRYPRRISVHWAFHWRNLCRREGRRGGGGVGVGFVSTTMTIVRWSGGWRRRARSEGRGSMCARSGRRSEGRRRSVAGKGRLRTCGARRWERAKAEDGRRSRMRDRESRVGVRSGGVRGSIVGVDASPVGRAGGAWLGAGVGVSEVEGRGEGREEEGRREGTRARLGDGGGRDIRQQEG